MELNELKIQEVKDQKIYHPLYGEIGEVKSLITHQNDQYIVFKERNVQPHINITLRAIPVKLFYRHHKTGELRVNFGAHWITDAPVFTAADLDQDHENVKLSLVEYYQNNSVWMGRINRQRFA